MGDFVELGRRLKRSLDGYISYRKAAAITVTVIVFFLYLGPSTVRWLLWRSPATPAHPLTVCLDTKLARYRDLLDSHNAHQDGQFLTYVGNGYFGLGVGPNNEFFIKSKRTLSLAVNFKPLVNFYLEGGGDEARAQITDYKEGVVTQIQCLGGVGWSEPVVVTSFIYAHRTLPEVLVQDVKIHNPGQVPAQLVLEKLGIAEWEGATSQTQVIEHGEGGQQYSLVTGEVRNGGKTLVVSVASRKMEPSVEVAPRMTTSLHILTGISYSGEGVVPGDNSGRRERAKREKLAADAVAKAAGMPWQSLQDSHIEAWEALWTTGCGISWSFADGAVNGNRVNATIYYILSQSASLLLPSTPEKKRSELQGYLSYAEGCYSGVRTLEAANLWTPLNTVLQVVTVSSYWLLTLEKNGCHNLVKAGADGVVQAIVLSLAGLKFSNQHLELFVHPKDLHRDISLRRVNYGNETHVNISVHVMEDNKAAIFVSLDKKNRDYYGCDAGCLDPPVKLGPVPVQFPVKLTDPLTAILYITADHEHMEDLKHTIHVKEVAEAPAHEPHVLELHRTGTRLGGLPVIFWVSIAAIIIVFHLFLFRLIYNEYCAGPDKYRIRKHSDYQ